MNVGQLKAALDKYSDELEVILSRDEEGNGFSPLAVAQLDRIDADGDPVHPDDVTDDPDCDDCDKTYIGDLAEKVILWP